MFKKQESGMTQADPQQIISQLMGNGEIKRYIKGRLLGKGGFAQCVQLISEQTGKRYAAKIINKETLQKSKARDKLQSQIIFHKGMKHKNIVKFEHYFEDYENVYILLQICSNNTMSELLKRRKALTEIEVKYYMLQAIQAVKYIHHRKVIHRDLKLANIFLNQELQIKVGDFGLATSVAYDGERKKTVCGTPNYIAPQILQSKRGHSYEVDIWSLGVMAYALLFGRPPFQTNQVKTTYQKIKIGSYTFPTSRMVSESAKDFIKMMLCVNPANRATLKQLLSCSFLTFEAIPKKLPISSLACPPSQAFLQQIRTQREQEVKTQRLRDISEGMLSERASRTNNKMQFQSTGRLQSVKRQNAQQKPQKTQRSLLRHSSTAALIRRKGMSVQIESKTSKIWVKQFQQHQKYGLFYRLSNQATGMRFNDKSCLVANKNFNKFKYVAFGTGKEQVQIFGLGQQNENLQKKMKIISHFERQRESSSAINSELNAKKEDRMSNKKDDKISDSVYVVSYFVTPQCTIFSLSNKNFHARFKDGTDIMAEGVRFWKRTEERWQIVLESDTTELIKNKIAHVTSTVRRIKKIKENKQGKENVAMSKSSSACQMLCVRDIARARTGGLQQRA